VRFLRYHAAVEAALQASGIAYTLLHPNLFMQGLLNFRSTIATRNALYAAGDAKVSMIDLRDIADVAVAALTEAGHEGNSTISRWSPGTRLAGPQNRFSWLSGGPKPPASGAMRCNGRLCKKVRGPEEWMSRPTREC
jgi:uncharacterized protein YbjT (DUF2867 family)